MTDKPTIPPEVMKSIEVAMDGSYLDGCDCFDCHKIRNTLIAAHPHLRRAILEAELPLIVEMARERVAVGGFGGEPFRIEYEHTPASILAALEKGEA